MGYAWYTYGAEQEIENGEFLNQLSNLGYDRLATCSYLYDSIADAYNNIGVKSDTKKVLEDFISGKIDAVDYVEEVTDIPEDGFVMRSFEDYYNNIIVDKEIGWVDVAYIDFDNDGEDELYMRGYMGGTYYFDVIGDTVYKLLEAHGTANSGNVSEMNGRRVIDITDLLHGGRKIYEIMQYDSCCCLVDWFTLSAGYDGDHYSAEDEFLYRMREISMEEFEEMVNSIVRIELTDIRDSEEE